MFCKVFNKQILISRKVKPCCVFEGGWIYPKNVDNIFDFYKKNIKNIKNISNPGCIQCNKKEKIGLKSKREYYEKYINDTSNINYIDIRFSNICNLKCRFCESGASSKWEEDEKFLISNGFNRIGQPVQPYYTPKKVISQVIQHIENIENDIIYLEIKGGEPFISLEFLSFLTNLSISSKNKIDISITTNGVSISKDYLDELKKFYNVTIYLSIETSDKLLYKYLRGGPSFSINNFEEKIELLKRYNFNIKISTVISIFNIFDIDQLALWLKEKELIKDDFIFSSFIHQPDYLDPGILPKEIKEVLIQKYKNNRILSHIVKYLKKSKYDKEKLRSFYIFNSLLDKKRDEILNIKELKDIYESEFMD